MITIKITMHFSCLTSSFLLVNPSSVVTFSVLTDAIRLKPRIKRQDV